VLPLIISAPKRRTSSLEEIEKKNLTNGIHKSKRTRFKVIVRRNRTSKEPKLKAEARVRSQRSRGI